MFRYIVRRLLQMVLTFFGATFVVYALMFAYVDDPLQALAGERTLTDSQRAALTPATTSTTASSRSTGTTSKACSPATSASR
jgi:ABC-type dipeptide/oligopeptide/nickel transport system permease component